MNTRTVVLIGAVALLGVGLLLTIADVLRPKPSEPRVTVALAAQQIEPYTVITQDMVKVGDPMRAREAHSRGAWEWEHVVGKMSTALIAPGTLLTAVEVKPIEDVRFVEDLGLEIVSFQAGTDRVVGGKLRPGHIINLYGFSSGSVEDPSTVLIEPRLWVVGVSSAGQSVTNATPRPDLETGELEIIGGERDRPGTMITVAVLPETAFHIIEALGSQRLSPWVSLAANQTVSAALATPVVAATPGLPPDLALTATALVELLRATPPPPPPPTGYGGTQ